MPTIRISGREFKVSEISEKGLRVIVDTPSIFANDSMIEGQILLHSTDTHITIKGKVLRIVAEEVIFILSEGISFKEMISEQRYMRKHYPNVLPKGSLNKKPRQS